MPDPRFIDWIREKLRLSEAEIVDKWLETHRWLAKLDERSLNES